MSKATQKTFLAILLVYVVIAILEYWRAKKAYAGSTTSALRFSILWPYMEAVGALSAVSGSINFDNVVSGQSSTGTAVVK